MSENFKCSICLAFSSENHTEDYFVSTKGGHIFHFLCIKAFIDRGSDSCPMCRSEVVTLTNLTRLYGVEPTPVTKYRSISPSSFPKPKPDHTFKIVLLGNSSVGKSSLLKRFSDGVFQDNLTATTGCDLIFKNIFLGGKNIKLVLWDTIGQEKYRSIALNCVRNAHGIILVYDVTDPNSLNSMPEWMEFVHQCGLPEAAKVIVGNKCDKEDRRAVPTRQGRAVADRLDISFFETSARDDLNVEATFRWIVAEILSNPLLAPEYTTENSLPNSNSGCRLKLPSRQDSDESYSYPTGSFCLC